MTNFKKGAGVALALGILIASLAGCQKQEGPAESAGKTLDNAIQKAGEKIEEAVKPSQKEEGAAERAGKALDSAVQRAGEKIEEAGQKIQDAARDAKK